MTQTSKYECCANLQDVLAPRFFKALCDPTRITILIRLVEHCGELSVSQVSECCPINISVVSRHLATLRDAGILKSVKRGKEVFYSVQAKALVQALRVMADEIEKCCLSEKENEHE